MIRTVERSEVVTKTEEVRICDRCGLEANPGRKLRYGVSLDWTERAQQILESGRHQYPTHHTEATVVTRARDYLTINDNGYVRVCDDCFEEMFSWSKGGD